MDAAFSRIPNDDLTLVYFDRDQLDALRYLQVAHRFGSNVHLVQSDSTTVVIPKGTTRY